MNNPISPLDGRYYKEVEELAGVFSEEGLYRWRVKVQLEYVSLIYGLLKNSSSGIGEDKNLDMSKIKKIEESCKHDVKTVEIYLREKLPPHLKHFIHLALTSEDINNLAYSLMFQEYLQKTHLPQLQSLMQKLLELTSDLKAAPFVARTHGQLASPTTAGKEFAVFLNRLYLTYEKLASFKFSGKIAGATGNFSTFKVLAPQLDWTKIIHDFIEQKFNLQANLVVTQVEDNDNLSEFLYLIKRQNNILIDLARDMWMYISYGYFTNKKSAVSKTEVGSSTMPHKINPIDFENSEGNLLLANNMLGFFIDQLPRSRMQRDLVNSTLLRNVGVALAHTHLAVKNLIKGLTKLELNGPLIEQELNKHYEVLAEPIQIILKREQIKNDRYDLDPYEQIKELFRGQAQTQEDYLKIVEKIDVTHNVREEIKKLTPQSYLGYATQIAEGVMEKIRKIK